MTTQSATLPTGIRFIGLALNQGVYRSHMLTFYLACYAAIMLATFVPQTQPFLLAEVLQLETSRQGVVSGNLNFWGEIVIIVTVGLWGSLSDRVGRRTVIACIAWDGDAFWPEGTHLQPQRGRARATIEQERDGPVQIARFGQIGGGNNRSLGVALVVLEHLLFDRRRIPHRAPAKRAGKCARGRVGLVGCGFAAAGMVVRLRGGSEKGEGRKDDSGDWKGKLETGDYAFDVADVKKK